MPECYKCSECGNWYKDRKMASKCREWCRKNPACNPALKKQAVKNAAAPKKNKQGVGIDGCNIC